jgi:hypothetical protein
MLIEKLRLKNAIETKQPKKRVAQFFDEYEEAYLQLHHPSENHKKDYVSLYFVYSDYMKRRDLK